MFHHDGWFDRDGNLHYEGKIWGPVDVSSYRSDLKSERTANLKEGGE